MRPSESSLPHSIEAERSVLGGVLLDPRVLDQVESQLDPSDFYRPSHATIYRAMTQLAADRVPIDLVTLTEFLKNHDQLDACGGVEYLASLDRDVPSASHAASYASIVREKAVLRRLIRAAADIQAEGLSGPEDIREFIDRAEGLVFQVAQSRDDRALVHVSAVTPKVLEVLQERFDLQDDVTGVPTGYLDLDKRTAGLQPGDLIILAARPSKGKTALALNLAANAALRGGATVAIFSLEMTTLSLVMRLISSEGRVRSDYMRTGKLPPSDWTKLARAAEAIGGARIYIDDTPALGLSQLRSKCRRLKAQQGLDLVIIDYLQLMRGPRTDSREQEIASISRGLKEMAKELDVPVLALSQLNRAIEQRKDKRPQLSDLRESGAIEQDADVILFIHRDDQEDPNQGVAEIIIAKQRNGPTDTIQLVFFKEYTRFDNYERSTPIP